MKYDFPKYSFHNKYATSPLHRIFPSHTDYKILSGRVRPFQNSPSLHIWDKDYGHIASARESSDDNQYYAPFRESVLSCEWNSRDADAPNYRMLPVHIRSVYSGRIRYPYLLSAKKKQYYYNSPQEHSLKVPLLPSVPQQPNNQHKMRPDADCHIRLPRFQKHTLCWDQSFPRVRIVAAISPRQTV